MSYIYLLANMIAKDQSAIIRPISVALGYIMDFFFNLALFFTEPHSLGISVVLLTIAARTLMLPLAFKSQKSMSAMKKIQPDIEKIKKKYGDNKDPEVQQKMNREMQALYTKHKVNPFGGCLPLIIQMPIFFALNYMMQQTYLFVNKLGEIYHELADVILSVPDRFNYLVPIIDPKVPKGMILDISHADDLMKALNRFTSADWSNFLSKIPLNFVNLIEPMLHRKESIEFFFGINLKEYAGTAFPGILIPILAAGTTFLSSWLMNKQQPPADNQQAKTMQKVMTYGMPVFIGFTTINFYAGVGLYWITSTVYQIFQQMFLSRAYENKEAEKEKIIEHK